MTPKMELFDVAFLQDDPNNARTHSEEQIAQVVASIRRFGFTSPVLVDVKGGARLVAGHCRKAAVSVICESGEAIHLPPGPPNGPKLPLGKLPGIDCSGWTEVERKAYALADNQLALNAGWDAEVLSRELSRLAGDGFEMNLLGFDSKWLDGLLNPPPDEDPDAVPPPLEVAVSRPGDVWLLGRNRLVCGDSTDPATVAKCLNGTKPHLMVTDPPYGVEYDASWREGAGVNTHGAATGKVLNDHNADWREAWALFPGDVAYVWHAGLFASVVADSLASVGLEARSQIIWAKSQLVMSRGDYHWQHEPCWYCVRKGKRGHYVGGRQQTTLWEIGKPQASETGHSTQKPIECMKRPIENNSQRGDAVYEPFSGSGTTLIAGEMTGRPVHAIELSPTYVDMAVQRWEAFTGQKARLEGGDTFLETASKRGIAVESADS